MACHRDSPYAKFWGACNEQKWALDRCFREEKAINRYARLSLSPLLLPAPAGDVWRAPQPAGVPPA